MWDALLGEKHIFTIAPTSAVLGESCLFVFSMFELNWPELVQINLEQFITSDPVASGAQFWTSCFLPASPLCFAGLAFLPPSASSSSSFSFSSSCSFLLFFFFFSFFFFYSDIPRLTPKTKCLETWGMGWGNFVFDLVACKVLAVFRQMPKDVKQNTSKEGVLKRWVLHSLYILQSSNIYVPHFSEERCIP